MAIFKIIKYMQSFFSLMAIVMFETFGKFSFIFYYTLATDFGYTSFNLKILFFLQL